MVSSESRLIGPMKFLENTKAPRGLSVITTKFLDPTGNPQPLQLVIEPKSVTLRMVVFLVFVVYEGPF